MYKPLSAIICFLLISSSVFAADTFYDPIYNIKVAPEKAFMQYQHQGATYYLLCQKSLDALNANVEVKPPLVCGWYFWDPYQYIEMKNNYRELTGLDVALVKQIFTNIGIDIDYTEVSWSQHQNDLKEGVRDIAGGAFYTNERAEYCYYSEPYRSETNVLYLPKGKRDEYDYSSVEDLLTRFQQQGFRLGVVDGYAYASDELNNYIAENNDTGLIVKSGTEENNFQMLFTNKIDGFFVDRIAGATIAWRNKWQGMIDEYPLPIGSSDIYVLFSKQTTSPALVEAFNQSLEDIKQSGEYQKTIRNYMFPLLLLQTLDKKWFLIFDIIGTIAFSISGLLLAKQGSFDIFGAFVLASLPAIGGGIMRDIIVGRQPIGVLRTPLYLEVIIISVFIGYIISKIFNHLDGKVQEHFKQNNSRIVNLIIQIFDGIGLAAFTIIGVVVAVDARCEPLGLWAPLLAAVTSSGGGILRDIVSSGGGVSSLKGSFYPEISVLWGFILYLFLIWQTTRLNQDEIFIGVVITLIGGFLTRLAALHYKIKSPIY